MDQKDEEILKRLMGNARMTYQELGDALGISRVAAMKRVRRLEEQGIIRGYNTCIYREDEVTVFIDLETRPEGFSKVLEYVSTQLVYVRQIYRTGRDTHIHMVVVAPTIDDVLYLTTMIRKHCSEELTLLSAQRVSGIIKDVYGGVAYERKDHEGFT